MNLFSKSTLDDFQRQSLEVLCQDKGLGNTEIFQPNGFYGHAAVLKQHAGLPLSRPMKGIIQHGYDFLSEDFIFGGEFEAPLPVFFPPNPTRACFYERLSNGKPAIPIGAPFLYAREIIDNIQSQPNRTGTIVFPVHSTRFIKAEFDHADYADKLAQLPEAFHPISVSIYWRDYQLGAHLPYLQRGFEVVSAGHMLDPGFIFRVYLNCRRFKYACSNEYGSSLFYSVASGCSYFYYPSDDLSFSAESGKTLILEEVSETQRKKFELLFSQPLPQPSQEQQDFVFEHLGLSSLKTSQELRKLLVWAEWLDKIRFTPIPAVNKPEGYPDWYLRLPSYWRRALRGDKWLKKRKQAVRI
ncbi:hypothetical protein [Vampirovibrio chlorellavorus]|uniref:hypothetical protein n=1 Tax=Vampirovibrio chlorellavorus TaxID=758823 RepID=UPI0026F2DB36|nr:hypothetical protein [Vampirovibrio chlorellavorus]